MNDKEDDLSLFSIGDVYINREKPETSFKNFENLFNKADITFGNLEAALTDKNNPSEARILPMKADPKMILGFKEGGIDIVTLANNHTTDFGPEGLMDTVETVESNDITQIGAGSNFEEAHKAKIITKNNVRVAFLGYECTIWSFGGKAKQSIPGVSKINVSGLLPEPHVDKLDYEDMKEDIRKAKNKADAVVVSFHFGLAPFSTLASHQPFLAHEAIEEGADVIIGHHPHRLQEIEVYKGKLICYSLGNFIFDNMFRYPQTSLVVETKFTKKGLKDAFLYPVFIDKSEDGIYEPHIAEKEEYQIVLSEIKKLSKDSKVGFVDEGNKIKVILD